MKRKRKKLLMNLKNKLLNNAKLSHEFENYDKTSTRTE